MYGWVQWFFFDGICRDFSWIYYPARILHHPWEDDDTMRLPVDRSMNEASSRTFVFYSFFIRWYEPITWYFLHLQYCDYSQGVVKECSWNCEWRSEFRLLTSGYMPQQSYSVNYISVHLPSSTHTLSNLSVYAAPIMILYCVFTIRQISGARLGWSLCELWVPQDVVDGLTLCLLG